MISVLAVAMLGKSRASSCRYRNWSLLMFMIVLIVKKKWGKIICCCDILEVCIRCMCGNNG